jgi:hypothetical protein
MDKVKSIQKEIDSVKDIMMENIGTYKLRKLPVFNMKLMNIQTMS